MKIKLILAMLTLTTIHIKATREIELPTAKYTAVPKNEPIAIENDAIASTSKPDDTLGPIKQSNSEEVDTKQSLTFNPKTVVDMHNEALTIAKTPPKFLSLQHRQNVTDAIYNLFHSTQSNTIHLSDGTKVITTTTPSLNGYGKSTTQFTIKTKDNDTIRGTQENTNYNNNDTLTTTYTSNKGSKGTSIETHTVTINASIDNPSNITDYKYQTKTTIANPLKPSSFTKSTTYDANHLIILPKTSVAVDAA